MNYQITSDNIQVSESMKNLALQKMHKIESRLSHVPEDLKSARIVMNTGKDDHFFTKIHLVIRGKDYFAEQSAYTLENSLVEAVNIIERDLQTDKIITREEDWKEAREAKRFDPADAELLEEELNIET